MRLLLIILLALPLTAAEITTDEWGLAKWMLSGMLKKESSSYFENGNIVYIDRKVGTSGELGPFQMKRIAWDMISKPGERFKDLTTNMAYAEECAVRYLYWIYNHKAEQNWLRAVGMYHAGWGTDRKAMNKRVSYLVVVRRYGNG